MPIKKTNCIVCDREFMGTSSALYCSAKCRQSNYRGKKSRIGYIYKLINSGVVVYVGQSTTKDTLIARIYSHSVGSSGKVFDSHEYYKVDGEVLNEVEAMEIIKHNPKYNKVLPRNYTYKSLKAAAISFSDVVDNIIISVCETYVLGDKNGRHTKYVKDSDMELLKEKVDEIINQQKIIIMPLDKYNKLVEGK